MKNNYFVIVGNIGNVFDGSDCTEAIKVFQHYMKQSRRKHGRGAGEDVTLFKNGEIFLEYTAKNNILPCRRCREISEGPALSKDLMDAIDREYQHLYRSGGVGPNTKMDTVLRVAIERAIRSKLPIFGKQRDEYDNLHKM